MLPFLYPDASTREALLADPQSAPIPPLHRELFRFAEKFVRDSWSTTPADLGRLRDCGLSDEDIVLWATLGSTQSWFTMSADGGGVPLEDGAMTGTAVGRTRDSYEALRAGVLAAAPEIGSSEATLPRTGVAWVGTDETSEAYLEAVHWAEERYGCVPNLLRSVSLQPGYFRRHQMALELLEKPQSASLSPRLHAMIRVLVSHLLRCGYSEPTTTALLDRATGDPGLAKRVCSEPLDQTLPALDQVALTLAAKFARNTYKVTEKDAIALCEAGLDHEAYVDILNTVSIQTSLDRLANFLGVQPDPVPLLPRA